MTQIKTFKFIMSNSARRKMITIANGKNDVEIDRWDETANKYCPVASEKEIDKAINKFISDKNVVNILINDYTIDRHNNGRDDTIERTYTIIYNN